MIARFICRRPSFGMIVALVIAITVATSTSSHAQTAGGEAVSAAPAPSL
ncbi:hypothetical protein [Piscinibacter terrae]|nr:hypothetical protein [Albitalea terrae]